MKHERLLYYKTGGSLQKQNPTTQKFIINNRIFLKINNYEEENGNLKQRKSLLCIRV